MTLNSWRILAIVFLVLSLLFVLFLALSKPLKNKYYYSCRKDKLLKTEKKKGAHYNVFEVLGRSAYYIDKYILKQIGKNKALICDYAKSFQYICYYLLLFDKKGRLMKIMEVTEYNTSFCSKPIKLPKNCTNLNIVVKKVDDLDLNVNLKGEVSLGKVTLFSVIESLALFSFLFAFRHLLVEIMCLDAKLVFLWSSFNVYAIVIIALISLINYFIISSRLKTTYNHKKVKGGK